MTFALTLWRPWDHSIIHGPKRVENRPWRPPQSVIGTDVALHAGLRFDDSGAAFILERGHILPNRATLDMVAGHVVGVVRIVRAIHKPALDQPSLPSEPNDWEVVVNDPWAFGPWIWVLDNVRPLATPVPCKGAQGLWRLPADVDAAVRAQVAGTQTERGSQCSSE